MEPEPSEGGGEPDAEAEGEATLARDLRWYSHQPNLSGQGIIAAYSGRFWVLTVLLGVICGIGASVMIGLLNLVEALAYGSGGSGFLAAVAHTPALGHVAALMIAAAIVILGLRVLKRLPTSGGTEVSDALWLQGGHMAWRGSVARGVLSIVTVGLGVSLGREAAPQLVGAASASKLATWAHLPTWQRRLLVASGAGAGFAAVYNVPLGGTLLAMEVMLGTLALPLVLPALITSVTATVVAWITLGTRPSYAVPTYAFHPTELLWAVLMGPVIGIVAVVWIRLISGAAARRPRGRLRWVAPPAVFLALALLSVQYPTLLGNGKDIVQLAVVGKLSLGLLVVLFLLKPLVTAACISSGSPGGLFTPTFSVGVLFTSATGILWSHIWGAALAGSYALIGGGAFLAACMQGPLSGAVLVLELTRHFDALMVPTLIAVAEATIVARRFGSASIYSARLRLNPEASASASAAAVATLHALDETLPADFLQAPVSGSSL
jgi:CIC family chloride channel protein